MSDPRDFYDGLAEWYHLIFWEWQGPTYRLTMRIRPVDAPAGDGLELQTTYYAVPIHEVLALMTNVGLTDVQRIDGVFYQPLLLGTVPRTF